MSDMQLLGSDDVSRYLNKMLDSHEWWFLIDCLELGRIVESRYYQNSAAFEIIMGPGAFSVIMAKKENMSPLQLADCIIEKGGVADREKLAEDLEKRDVVSESFETQIQFAAMIGKPDA